jgi:amino acid transporter
MTVRGAALLGVGAMVGAGIFALLGEAGAVAGGATWLSFLLAGIVSLLIGYNVVKLGVRYPSSGGLFEYLLQGFGNGRLLGIAAWLGYMSAVLIVCSMCAVSFGDYAVSLFVSDGGADWWDNVFTSAIVVAMALVVVVGPQLVAKAQSLIVFIMVGILGVFVAVTLPSIDLDLLAFDDYPPVSDIVASVALTFFAFLGFSVITFAAGDMRDPARDLPKAMNRALGVTTLVYVLVAVSVFGTLTVDEVVRYGPTAIAEAGRPALGDAGFTMIAVAAMVGMAGSVVATLYASAGLTGMLSDVGQFPPFFGRGSRLGAKSGVLISAAVVLVVANTVDLSAIASVGSACSLMIFVLVGAAGYRVRGQTGAQAWLILVGIAVTLVVLAFFVVDTLRNSPETFAAMAVVATLAVVLDIVWKRVRGKPPAGLAAPAAPATQE